jgi:hypothetical protein
VITMITKIKNTLNNVITSHNTKDTHLPLSIKILASDNKCYQMLSLARMTSCEDKMITFFSLVITLSRYHCYHFFISPLLKPFADDNADGKGCYQRYHFCEVA